MRIDHRTFADSSILFVFPWRPHSCSLKDFKEFAGTIESVKDKGVVVAVASPDDVDAANKECNSFFQVKKVL